MTSAKLFFGVGALCVASFAQTAPLEPLIDSFQLVDLLETQNVKVLEVRGDEEAYQKNHIPGSVFIPYAEFRGPESNPGKLPLFNQIANSLGARGIDSSDSVVIVHDGITTSDFGVAARVYWTLKTYGFDSLAILNGGFRGYEKDGFSLADGRTIAVETKPTLVFNPRWYADTIEVEGRVSGQGEGMLLDARLDDFYAGKAWHDSASRPGILPGAKQFSFEEFFDKNTPLLKHPSEIQVIVEAEKLDRPGTISYCNTGHWAATNWFILSEVAKIHDVKLYAESMVEWSTLNKPMENVPTSLEFAFFKTKKWLGNLVN